MIVSSGKFKGRRLADNHYAHIRPTADIVKQAIFNKLTDEVQNAKVLDLFCGTGALGIEAISRGAKEVVFADKDARSIAQTKSNLKSLLIDNARIIKADFKDALKKLQGEKFDIVLLDPPYLSGVYEEAIELINQYNLTSEEGIIVCEHEKNVEIKHKDYSQIDQKRYGIKMVTYLSLRRKNENADRLL